MNLKSATWAKLAAMSVLAVASAAANADTYNFSLTGDYTASWTLNSNPVPDVVGEGQGFVLWDIEGNFPGASEGIADLTFYSASIGGGFEIYDFWADNYLVVTDGTQLYTGSEASPTFKLGTFNLTEYLGSGTYTLTVSAVPEPATVVSMLAGLGLIGVALRRRRTEEV